MRPEVVIKSWTAVDGSIRTSGAPFECELSVIALISQSCETTILILSLSSGVFVFCPRFLLNLRRTIVAVTIILFCLFSAREFSREPPNIYGSSIDYSVFFKGTLPPEKAMPDIISKMLRGSGSGIGLLVPDVVEYIRAHPINLESKWALNILNQNFLAGNNGIELSHLDELLNLCDPVFAVLNVDEDMKIWLLHMLQRYMAQPGIVDKSKALDFVLQYAPYLIERGPTERVRSQGMDALRTLAENADFEMLPLLFDASFDLLKDETIPYDTRLGVEDALRRVAFRFVIDMRVDHLEKRLSDEVISAKLTAITNNDPVKLYAFFTDHWMYGTLADEIFSRLEKHARLAGKELYTYLEDLDPLKHFFESFLFSSINFSKSNRWFQKEDTMQRSFRYIFSEISRESLTANAALTQVFVEKLLAEKGPFMSWKSERLLLDEYERSTGFHKYFIAATIVLHRGWFSSLEDETIDSIEQENEIDLYGFPSDRIDYSQILDDEKHQTVDAYVIFFDKDSLDYYKSAIRMFSIRGYRQISREKDRVVLEKRGSIAMRVTIDNKTDVTWRLGDEAALSPHLKIVMIRGHHGIQEAVFSGQGTEITAGTHVILSLCRGMYEASRYRFKYPDTFWIASQSSVVGIMANAVMISLIDGFRMKKPTYSSIKAEAMRLSPATKDFVYPNDPAFVIGSLLKRKEQQFWR